MKMYESNEGRWINFEKNYKIFFEAYPEEYEAFGYALDDFGVSYDPLILEEQFESMGEFIEWLSRNRGLIRTVKEEQYTIKVRIVMDDKGYITFVDDDLTIFMSNEMFNEREKKLIEKIEKAREILDM